MINKHKLLKTIKSKDAKRLINNFAWLSVIQVAGYLFPLITLPYLAKTLGVDKFGQIAFALAVISYIQTVVDWGFNYTTTREIARNRDNKEKISNIFSNIFWCRISLTFISAAVLLILTTFIEIFNNNSEIIWMTFLIIPGHIMLPEWLFQGVEKMKYISILTFLSKCLFTILIFAFIKEKSDYIYQPLFTFFGFLASGLIAFYIIIFRWKIKILKPNLASMKKSIKGSFDVFINQFAPNLYNSLSVVILGFYGGTQANGQFDSGTKFVNIASQFSNIVLRTTFPYLSRKDNKHLFLTIITLIISAIISISLFVGAPLIIKSFYTQEFYDSIIVLQITSISIIFLSMYNMYGANYLLLKNKETLLRNITVIVSLLGLLLAFPLIYNFSYVGAAIDIAFTRVMLGSMTAYFAIKHKSITIHD